MPPPCGGRSDALRRSGRGPGSLRLSSPPAARTPGRYRRVAPHLNCTGESRSSRPTVILEAGIGDFSVEWSLVQPGVARFARVCSYDRAGDGWSDLGPHPRTMHQIVHALHTLLDQAGERPPYVLVGHSYGGWLGRLSPAPHPPDGARVGLGGGAVSSGRPIRRTAPGGCWGKPAPTIHGGCCRTASSCAPRISRPGSRSLRCRRRTRCVRVTFPPRR